MPRSTASAPAAAATAVAAAVQPFAAAAAVTAPTTGASIAGADVRELIGGLALHGGVVREAQADATALAVYLDHRHVELIALRQHVVHRFDPLARLHVRDMEQPVGALGELDERAERGGLDHLALELIADLGLLRHRLDRGDCSVDQRAARRVHLNRAVVLDVDVGLVLLRQAANRLAALANDRPDL